MFLRVSVQHVRCHLLQKRTGSCAFCKLGMDEDSLRLRLALNKSVLSTTESIESFACERFDDDERAKRISKRFARFAYMLFILAFAPAGNGAADLK